MKNLFTPEQQKALEAIVAKRVEETVAAIKAAQPAIQPTATAKGMKPAERRKALRALMGLAAKASYLQLAAESGLVPKALSDACVKAATEAQSLFVAKSGSPTGALFSAGGSLLGEDYATDVIGILYDATVVLQAGARPEAVHGARKNLGRLNSGAKAEFVEPGQEPTASEIDTGMVVLAPKKIMGIIEPTRDMLRDPTFAGGEETFTTDLLNAMGVKSDQQCLIGDGSGPRPTGLIRQVKKANVFNASAAYTQANREAIIGDLDKAERIVRESKHPFQGAKPGWVFSSKTLERLKSLRDGAGWIFRQQLDAGTLNGYPYYVTDSISGAGTGGKDLIIFGLWDTTSYGMGFGGEAPESGILIEMAEPKFTRDLVTFKGVGYVDLKLRYDSTFCVIDSIVYA
ncbi:phage major capsid protein [Vitiosangium sp. GDMCC 1.1324]|uniref:phage major capsid protein n=1 Tax=Vitiosangium sp. (strain GDMCC 1.1324) TaxID=2138576 RepID=UPI000D39E962|nr:phage major capsid protein [Vitiosangium sp. GDMCC 1.1324]PTL79095.1 phage major capsid protein [Vitiosangium sp. GDMCC 1.1324]